MNYEEKMKVSLREANEIIGNSDLLYGYDASKASIDRRIELANEIRTEKLSLNEILLLEKLIDRLNYHYELKNDTFNDLKTAIRYIYLKK